MVVRIHIAEIHKNKKKQPQRSSALQFSHLQDPKIKFQTNANAFICRISLCFLIKHIGKNEKSLRILHNGYRNGISTYRFNTLWSLDSRTYVLFDTPFFNRIFTQWMFCSGTCRTSKGYIIFFFKIRMIFSLVAMTGLHICSGYVTQVSDPWPVGLLSLVAMIGLENVA